MSKIRTQIFKFCIRIPSNPNYVQCKLCKRLLKCVRNTMNVRAHLRRHHLAEWMSQNPLDSDDEEMEKLPIVKHESQIFPSSSNDSNIVSEEFIDVKSNSKTAKGRHTSPIWKYYKKSISGDFVQCKICQQMFKLGSTTNLSRHLMKKHNIAPIIESSSNDHSTPEKTENIVIKIVEPKPNFKKTPNIAYFPEDQQKKVDNLLLKSIIASNHPISIVESDRFRAFTTALQPLYNPPSFNHLSCTLLPNLYSKIAAEIQTMIASIDFLSVSIKLWKNIANWAFLSFNIHFMKNSRVNCQNLSTVRIFEDLPSDKLVEFVQKIISDWSIDSKIVTIVIDSHEETLGESIDFLEKHRQPCIYNLFTTNINKVLEECSHFVELLQNVCYFLREKDAALPAFESLWSMACYLAENSVDLGEFLLENDLFALQEYISLMQPFKSFINELEKEEYAKSSLIIPLIRGVEFTLSKLGTETETGSLLKTQLREKVVGNLKVFEKNKVFAICTFLDPRFKKSAFFSAENGEKAEEWIKDEMAEFRMIDQSKVGLTYDLKMAEIKDSSDLLTSWMDFDDEVDGYKVGVSENGGTRASLVLRQYLELPKLGRAQCPLDFWDKHKFILSDLYQVYAKYFSVPATLGQCKQNSGLIGDNIDKISLLNSYFLYNK